MGEKNYMNNNAPTSTSDSYSVSELTENPVNLITKTLHKRYQIIDVIGQGGVGITYRAKDITNNGIVALKALSLRRARDWKAIELFEREAKVLSQLDHPAIPSYIDYFQVDDDRDRQFYIVQELALGESLANLTENDWQPSIDEIQDIAIQVLKISIYLHTLMPAVIHRDIKPQNLIRDLDGRIFLVDFGSVQDTYHQTITGGSTVVGTYGYMAPEQFRGQACFSTDLYGLGATIVYLLTKQDPGTLPQKKLKLDFRAHVSVPQEFADWLDRMLEPDIRRRFETANQALAVLQGQQELPLLAEQMPAHSKINLTKSADQLQINIPAVGLSRRSSWLLGLLTLGWNGILFLLIYYTLTIRMSIDPAKQTLFIFYGLIGLGLFLRCCTRLFSKSVIKIQCGTVIFRKLIGEHQFWYQEFYLADSSWRRQFERSKAFARIYNYQTSQSITTEECYWLLSEIEAFMERSPLHPDNP
jgi:eukaryotic-like serine/threonine-protein kinase